jgi:hypothetical protein
METLIIQGINTLIKRWRFVLATTVLLGFIGGIRGIVWPSYQAETMLVLTPLGATGETAKLLGALYPSKVYNALLLSPQTVGATLNRLVEQDHISKDSAPEIDDFTANLSVNVETVDATTRPVTYSPLIRLSARSTNKDLAVAIVREWSKVAIEQANKMLALPLAAASETLAHQSGELEKELDGIWRQVAEETGQFDVALMRKEAELRVVQLDKLEAEDQLTTRELDGLRKSLESVRETLAKEPPFNELAKAPSEDAYWITGGGNEKRSFENLRDKVMVSQELNAVYWDSKQKEAEVLSDIATHEAKLLALTAQQERARKEREALEAKIGEHTIKQRDLETQESIAKIVYEDVATSKAFNKATLDMIKAGPDSGLWPIGLNPLDENVFAVRSSSLLGGRRSAFAATLLGFLLSACAVIFRDVAMPWWRAALEKHRPIPTA